MRVLAEAGISAAAVTVTELGDRAAEAGAVLLDASLGRRPYGIDLVVPLLEGSPSLSIVVTVARPRPAGLVEVMEAGARAVLHRRCEPGELVASVSAALRDQHWVSAPVADVLREELSSVAVGHGPGGGLSRRELDVLRGLADGGSNADIGRRLGISEHTVRNHVHSLLGKLGVANRTDAVTTAVRLGLVDLTG